MPGHQIMYFATTGDISAFLTVVERIFDLQYTETVIFPTDMIRIYRSFADIPQFGHTTHPTAIVSPNFLLSAKDQKIEIRPVPQQAGGVRFAVHQSMNPDAITLRPGGSYGRDVLLCGSLGTVSQSIVSKKLYASVGRAFRKIFSRQEEFLVGPEAEALWRSGVRLTTGAESPTEFDLKPPSTSR